MGQAIIIRFDARMVLGFVQSVSDDNLWNNDEEAQPCKVVVDGTCDQYAEKDTPRYERNP
jgi:hypothetical protein